MADSNQTFHHLALLAAFIGVFYPSLIVVAMFGAPLTFSGATSAQEAALGIMVQDRGELPISVAIPSVGIATPVSNPTESNTVILDEALLSGAVRYPASGLLGGDRTILLFGHSSFLPQIRNRAYQTFNHLERVRIGDSVLVESKNTVYEYRVSSVTLTTADAARVDLAEGKHQLVLATCNSFGAKEERYVVTADFVGSHLLAK